MKLSHKAFIVHNQLANTFQKHHTMVHITTNLWHYFVTSLQCQENDKTTTLPRKAL
jgi:hypothetical protein